jgi:hypothetical protein
MDEGEKKVAKKLVSKGERPMLINNFRNSPTTCRRGK